MGVIEEKGKEKRNKKTKRNERKRTVTVTNNFFDCSLMDNNSIHKFKVFWSHLGSYFQKCKLV